MAVQRKLELEAQLAALQDLDSNALKDHWRQIYGAEPPKRMSQERLRRAVAYKLQEKVYGGLNPAIRRQLRQMAQDLRQGKKVSAPVSIKPGTRLVRSWQGKAHTVIVQEDCFHYDGQTYRSLSAIAKAITGTQWNGRLFFGLKTKAGSP
ncbi:MAG: DUF2924 domain-containing protein [Pseudomonadota bacterium]|nr:DUF2924 domain-containing protein [Pseudomonadota bacterium]